jgi:Tol biopolymer transport system component
VQPFDPETHELSGRPRELLRNVDGFLSRGDAHFSFADEGTLLVRSPSEESEIEWVARGGRSLGRVAEPDHYSSLRLDPRGERLAYTLEDSESGSVDLWVRDLGRGVSTRVTSHERWVNSPRWSPDGTRLAFAADWKGPPHVYLVDLDTREPVEIVPYDGSAHHLGCWTATGDAVIYGQRVSGSRHLWMVDLDGLERRPLIESPFLTVDPAVSTDGEWIAYASLETGRFEVYVATFPAIRNRTRVSTEGGREPLWNEDGTEIFYRSTEGVLAASFDAADPTIGTPDLVVPDWGGNLIEFNVSPNGQRFVVRRSGRDAQRPPDRLVTDWPRLLER